MNRVAQATDTPADVETELPPCEVEVEGVDWHTERRQRRPNADFIARMARFAATPFKKHRKDGWRWYGGTPDAARLAVALQRMTDNVLERELDSVEFGGLVVARDSDGTFRYLVELGTWHPPAPIATPEEARPHIEAARAALRRAG